MDLRTLDPIQMDGLREMANIGAGHAATALSQLAQCRVELAVPSLKIVRLEEADAALGPPDRVVHAVMMRMLGDVTGRAVQVFPDPMAGRLANLMLRRTEAVPVELGEIEQSALREAGNVILGAYIDALSEMLGLMFIMSPPEFSTDMLGAVLNTGYINFGDVEDYVICMNTQMKLGGHADDLGADFLLLPDAASLQAILRALRLGR